MKFSLIILSIFAIFAFTGCEDSGISTSKSDTLRVVCDNEKGVEYMGYRSGNGGGLSLRYNNDGSISTCPQSDRLGK